MTDDEIHNLDITNIPDDNPTGYILEVDLEYPHNLHELHNDYPLAPEKVTLTEEMLSPYSKSFPGKHVCQLGLEHRGSRGHTHIIIGLSVVPYSCIYL